MGKVFPEVAKHVPHGEILAASISTDHLIVAGVSNWGGYAISAALSILSASREAGADEDCRESDFHPTIDEDFLLLKKIVELGAVDGVLKEKNLLSIDGLPHDGIHSQLLRQMNQICATTKQTRKKTTKQ